MTFGAIQAIQLTASTIAIGNPINLGTLNSWTLIIQQDAVGGRLFTLGTNFYGDLSGLSTAANTQSQINFVIDNNGYSTVNSITTNLPEAPITPPAGPAPVLVSDLIYTAYRIAGVLLNAGTLNNPEEYADGLNALNALTDDWASQRLMIYTINRFVFTFVANQQSYQIGPGAADWDVPRPPRIETASVLIVQNASLPVEQVLAACTYEDFQQITVKNITSPIPQAFYYDQQFPIGNVFFYPIPQGPLNQVAIYVWQTIPQFTSITQVVQLPPAYLRALQYNLALELADRFPDRAKVSPRSVMTASTSLRNIKSLNVPIEDMMIDRAALNLNGTVYNYYSDSLLNR